MEKIYKQTYSGQCGSFACLNALTIGKNNKNVTEEEMLSIGPMLGFPAMRKKLKEAGLIKQLFYPITRNGIDSILSQGEVLVCKIPKNNFSSVRNPPHINTLTGSLGHFVCVYKDNGDTWQYRDSQGELFGDNGDGYILKSDFQKVTFARLLS